MSWTTARTWVAGEVVTAAIMNTHVRDNLKALAPPYATEGSKDVISTTTETSLWTSAPSIVGGDMGANGKLYCRMHLAPLYNTGTGDDLTYRVKFGGTTFLTWQCDDSSGYSATRKMVVLEVWVANRGATNDQSLLGRMSGWDNAVGRPESGGVALGKVKSALGTIDTTSTQTFDVTCQPQVSSANLATRKDFGEVWVSKE